MGCTLGDTTALHSGGVSGSGSQSTDSVGEAESLAFPLYSKTEPLSVKIVGNSFIRTSDSSMWLGYLPGSTYEEKEEYAYVILDCAKEIMGEVALEGLY